MKNSYKPSKVIDAYEIRKQLHGGFKIVEYSHMSNEKFLRKRVLHKNLTITDAEDKLYQLEKKQK